jgi:hypothetical protein
LVLGSESEQEKMNFYKYLSEYSTSNRNRIVKYLINTFSYCFCVAIRKLYSLLFASSSSLSVSNSCFVNLPPEKIVVYNKIKDRKKKKNLKNTE